MQEKGKRKKYQYQCRSCGTVKELNHEENIIITHIFCSKCHDVTKFFKYPQKAMAKHLDCPHGYKIGQDILEHKECRICSIFGDCHTIFYLGRQSYLKRLQDERRSLVTQLERVEKEIENELLKKNVRRTKTARANSKAT